MEFLLVAVGAAIGAPCRCLTDRLIQAVVVENHPKRLPLGTLTVNVLGSALLGLILAHANHELILIAGTGFCGAYTTFSTFTAQTDESIREGWHWTALANVVVSVVACYGVLFATYHLFK